jgi:hypothetical protein
MPGILGAEHLLTYDMNWTGSCGDTLQRPPEEALGAPEPAGVSNEAGREKDRWG